MSGKKSQLQGRGQGKGSPQKQPGSNFCGAAPSHPKEKCRGVLLKYVCRKFGKEGHVARKCMSKPQNVNAFDDAVCHCEREIHHLFMLDSHPVRTVTVHKGQKYFAVIKLSVTGNCFVWQTLQLDMASTTNMLAVDDLSGMYPAGFDIAGLIKPSLAILHTYGGGEIKPVGQIKLICETQGKLHTLQFQLLSKDVMGSQPPLLRGADCVKLGLIQGTTPSACQKNQQASARTSQVCHVDESSLQPETKCYGGTSMEDTPVSLKDSPGKKCKAIDFHSSMSPVSSVCEDFSEVHSTVACEVKVMPAMSKASELNFSHMPVPCGKLTKEIVMETFKDVHTGLGTLGPPLHITVNPGVTPVQAHPHRCPVAKEVKAAEAIRDLEKQHIKRKVTEPTAWISNSVYREKPDGSICVCIDPSQTINKAIEVPK